MKKRIITISREFGSGGHNIGKAVSERLGIHFYDQQLLEKIAEKTGLAEEFIGEVSEYATAKNSFLFNLVMNTSPNIQPELSLTDKVYITQKKIIEELAEKESCVIIGRCSDYILRDREDCLHVFICADKKSRAERVLERYGKSDKPIEKRLDDKDARRRIYYSHYTDRLWGMPQNYSLTLNSSALGEEACVNTIIDLFQNT